MIRSKSTLFVALSAVVLAGADWPAFRGPSNDGKSPEKDLPTTWSATENIKWKAPLPRPGNGSPIVVAGRVLVTSAEDADGKQRTLYCFDELSGKQLWSRTVELDVAMPTHKTNPYCGSTPVSDGKRVAVWHASGGLICYDLEGKELWSRDLGEFRHMWGYGTSPILHRGNLILHSGPGERVFLAAIDFRSGKTLWETEEPLDSKGDRNQEGKYQGSWSTPVIAQVDGEDQILVMMNTRINAYDADSGKIVWSCDGLRHDRGDLAYSSPVIVGDLCFVTGGFRGPALTIRMGGSGNVTEERRLWRNEKNPQNIGSGVAVDGYVYRPNAGPGTIDCIDPKTGEILWSQRGGANFWASIVAGGGLLYATNQKAETIVFRPDPNKFDPVATNKLEGACNATPALANGHIFIRTGSHLVCIGD